MYLNVYVPRLRRSRDDARAGLLRNLSERSWQGETFVVALLTAAF